jgi:hypothetical protein
MAGAVDVVRLLLHENVRRQKKVPSAKKVHKQKTKRVYRQKQ